MKKVLSIEQIRQADAFTIAQEPIASADLMERAATGCYHWIKEHVFSDQKIAVFCGQGNNGGDGLVIARLFANDNIPVDVFYVEHSLKPSDDFLLNLHRLREQYKATIHCLNEGSHTFLVQPNTLIIDALLGSGITKPTQGVLAEIIDKINGSGCYVVSVDIPSGLFCDQPNDTAYGAIINANITLTFEVPKLAFFWPENDQYVGEWDIVKIGLHPEFLQHEQTTHFLLERNDIFNLLHPRKKFAHKGNYGHGLLISGSYGKMGAAVLGARAALRSGAGLLTVHLPGKGCSILQSAVPEAMVSIDASDQTLSCIPKLDNYNAIAIGPGIGTGNETARTLKLLIQESKVPLIIDADAINILSENKTWLSFLPPLSILTPHFKEFERLTAKAGNSFERNRLQREFSIKYNVYIVLKGAYTCISYPDGYCYFNPTGNPGMATGGSGDVLTGIILGFLAQGYTPGESVVCATYLHGLAGDIAATIKGQTSMIAGDIVDNLPAAFMHFEQIVT
ncbi:MAG: NAD(P)H-hydrate dehydratase [Bacteroidales bacterium]